MELVLTYPGDQALEMPDISSSARAVCVRPLYRICGQYRLLPQRWKVPVCYDRAGIPLFQGGYGDVWKGEYCGRDVAVKVIRTYSTSNLEKIIGVSGWQCPPSEQLTTDDDLCRRSAKKL